MIIFSPHYIKNTVRVAIAQNNLGEFQSSHELVHSRMMKGRPARQLKFIVSKAERDNLSHGFPVGLNFDFLTLFFSSSIHPTGVVLPRLPYYYGRLDKCLQLSSLTLLVKNVKREYEQQCISN